MTNKVTITLIIMVLFSVVSFAADNNAVSKNVKKKYSQKKTGNPCESPSGVGQQECAGKKFEIADKKLNSIYKVLLAKLPEVDGTEGGETGKYPKRGLIEAQKAWIKYRDANCDFYGDIYGGAPVWRSAESLNCRVTMTEIRTKELQKYLDDYK